MMSVEQRWAISAVAFALMSIAAAISSAGLAQLVLHVATIYALTAMTRGATRAPRRSGKRSQCF